MNKLLTLLVWIIGSQLLANNNFDNWTDHYSYSHLSQIVETDNLIASSNNIGILVFNKSDNSVKTYSRSNGLSDINITAIQALPNDIVIIGYENGNMDILENGNITNFPDLKNKNLKGSKKINHFNLTNDLIYISTDFSILVFDIENHEFSDIYYLGDNSSSLIINKTLIIGDEVFASTANGILKAKLDDPLISFFESWAVVDNDTEIKDIAAFNGKLLKTMELPSTQDSTAVLYLQNDSWVTIDSVLHFRKVLSTPSKLIIARQRQVREFSENFSFEKTVDIHNLESGKLGLNINNVIFSPTLNNYIIADEKLGLILKSSSFDEQIIIDGPISNNCYKLVGTTNGLYSVAGGVTEFFNPLGSIFEYSLFSNGNWSSKQLSNRKDAITICQNKAKPNEIYFGGWSWGSGGVIQADQDNSTTIYSNTNSTVQTGFIGGMASDNDGNIWIENSLSPNGIIVKSNDGTWYSHYYETLSGVHSIRDFIFSEDGYIWMGITAFDNPDKKGLFVINTNNTPYDTSDDLYRGPKNRSEEVDSKNAGKLELLNENGEFHSKTITALAEDKNGYIWVGTDNGILVYYQPSDIFNDESPRANRILVPRNDGSNNADFLLDNEYITCITVDGANRKWIGTESSGAYLVSEDGKKTYLHFDTDNSPLPRNYIKTIGIDPNTGDVFFGTAMGITSYKGDAIEPDEEMSNIHAFPNPVRETYDGPITIHGMSINSSVKITTVSGKLVHESKSLGGSAQWDGRNLWGEKVKSGVYIVYVASEDGSKYETTKILIVR